VYNESDMLDGKLWIGCVKCDKWNHASCEIELGEDEEMKALAIDEEKLEEDRKNREPDAVSEDNDSKDYFCLKCRKKYKTPKITKPLAPKKAPL